MVAETSVVSAEEIDFAAETELDETFDFSRPLVPDALNPESVFLTGATGLLGAYLLDELITRTRACVHCLVRAADEASAWRRLVDHLKHMACGAKSRRPACASLLETSPCPIWA